MFPAVGDAADRSRFRMRVALCLWIAVILLASADAFSMRNTEALLRRVDPEPRPHEQIVALRALVHLVEYGLLGLLAHRSLRGPGRGRIAALGLALGLSLAVAVADESIQATQPHRSGSYRDVILDLLGSSVGVGVSLGYSGWVRLARARQEDA